MFFTRFSPFSQIIIFEYSGMVYYSNYHMEVIEQKTFTKEKFLKVHVLHKIFSVFPNNEL